MTFYTCSKTERPVRLSEETRQFAWESMHGKYGDDARHNHAVCVDKYENWDEISEIDRYDTIIREIAENAPIRICPHERVSGSANLGFAIDHCMPAIRNNEHTIYSISHLTVGYEKMLRIGVDGIEKELTERLGDELNDKERRFLLSMKSTVDSMRIWHKRYLDATKTEKPETHELLKKVPFSPAESFKEAVQAIWFEFAFLRLCGNWPGIGRIDVLLGDYLRRDLENGDITLDEAREVLASLFIKGCEWIESNTTPASGDAQHYQNIVLGGTDENGVDVTNEVSYLVLDIVEETGISDFPITVRLHKNTPEKLMRRAAEVIRHGGGIVAFYDEETVISALVKNGYDEKEAHRFANDGCWEVQIPGATCFSYSPFDSLQIFNTVLGLQDSYDNGYYGTWKYNLEAMKSIDDVYDAFLRQLKNQVLWLYYWNIERAFAKRDGKYGESFGNLPSAAVSLFTDGCIENAAHYYDLGPKYTVRSPHIGGAPDVANSLHAIDELVFKKKLITLPELVETLRNDWEGAEALRLYAKNKITYYGNDDDEADKFYTMILDDFADMVHEVAKKSDCPAKFVPGVSTFGRQLNWLPQRTATAFGAKKGDILAPNAAATPGTDITGATAEICSYCKADLTKQTSGAALDIRIFPETLDGEDGVDALISIMKGFVTLGGFFIQIDTLDKSILFKARENPEAYKTLSVRVSGWNARFVTLDKQWQDMIIERNES